MNNAVFQTLKTLAHHVVDDFNRNLATFGLRRAVVGVQLSAAAEIGRARSWADVDGALLRSIVLDVDAVERLAPAAFTAQMAWLRAISRHLHGG